MAADTGSAILPDIGELSYNGVSFSSLYKSDVKGKEVLDNAGRTVKYMKYTITVDGVVTLDDDVFAATTDHQWQTVLRDKLTQQAGTLYYTGKGFGSPFIVNQSGGTLFDVAWGPIPEVLDFIPLGSSRSAFIKFVVTTCIPELPRATGFTEILNQVLQFNEETNLSYDEAGFSHISIRGTLEIPLTRIKQTRKDLPFTVDDFRQRFMSKISDGFDLERFQVSKRNFDITRDKRTLEWDFQLDELGWMGLPGGMLEADGSVSMRPFKPAKALQGTVQWLCTMRATYTVPNGTARRLAWLAFLALWNFRMRMSEFALPAPANVGPINATGLANAAMAYASQYQNRVQQAVNATPGNVLETYRRGIGTLLPPGPRNKSFPLSLTFDEGLYKGSKTISFEASWRFLSLLSTVLVGSGLWRKTGLEGGNFWARSIRNISGGTSWLANQLDASGAAIVDFGG